MSKLGAKETTMTIRVSHSEKAALTILARSRGLSLSEFVVSAAKSVGSQVVGDLKQVADFHAAMARKRPTRRRKVERDVSVGNFKVPYLQRRHAAPFEDVVRYVAREMQTDEMSVAILMTHVTEGIADVLASGQVFRWPGLFVVGPYRIETSEGSYCVPRFQANPPLKNLVRWSCDVELACNRSLDAHRRRRRPDRHGTIRSLMEATRYTIAGQDLRALEAMQHFDSDWRSSSPLHEL